MTASAILSGWILPGAGLLFFAAGAWVNAGILFGGKGGSPVPFAPGAIGAIALWNAPFEWMHAYAWVPLLLDAGCVPYLGLVLLVGIGGLVSRSGEVAVAVAEHSAPQLHYERAFAGCLLGTAVGDALGLAAEGLPPNRQRRLFPQMDRYHLLPFGRGMCSDDTEHTIMVAQALHQSVGYTFAFNDAARFRSNLAWWMRWWLLGLPAGIGMATLKGILKLWLFAPGRWQGTFSAGNAPAMRSALIGAFWQEDARFMRLHVEASTQLTHSDPKALQAAHAVALAASLSSQHAGRVDAAVFVQRVCDELGSGAEEFRALLERVAASVRAGEDTQAFAQLLGLNHGVTGYSFHTVPVALHAWLSHPGDYRGAVLAAIRCGGDTDTVGAITGAIAAAGTGPEGIPAEWLDRLAEWPHTVPWMRELATTLARAKTAGFTNGSLPRSSPFKLGLRNLFFLAVVLVHGFRRLLPPY